MAVKVTIILAVLPDREGTEINWGWDEDVEWTGCLHNHGPQKMWIDGAEEDDLAGKIKEVRFMHSPENMYSTKAPRKRLGTA
jgi:hypothetical protein